MKAHAIGLFGATGVFVAAVWLQIFGGPTPLGLYVTGDWVAWLQSVNCAAPIYRDTVSLSI